MGDLASLRPYQQLAIEHTHQSVAAGNRAVYFTLPTGTGKTHVLSHLASGYGQVLALAHRVELIDQLAARFRKDWDRGVGIVRGPLNQWGADIVVATPQTLRDRRLATIAARSFDVLFIDEAHHVTPGSRYDCIMDALGEIDVIGCTATPYRADKRRMQAVLPVCTFSRTIDEMQAEGWLCPLTWHPIRVEMDLAAIESVQTVEGRDYRPEALAKVSMQGITLASVVEQTMPFLDDRPTVAFAVNVEHAQVLAAAYEQAGIRAEAIWGTMPRDQRAEILSAWRAGAVQLVANCGILTEGFDFPEIAVLVMARPTRSAGLYMQMLGRGTRRADGKTDCRVLDVTGMGEMDDTLQIIMPDMVSIAGGETETEPHEHRGQSADVSESGSRIRSFRDPSHDIVYRWIRDEGRYILPAADGVTLVMQSDPAGSGLYHLAMLRRERRVRLSRWPDTIWEQQRHAADWLASHAVAALSHRDQEWHEQAPTERQLIFLGKLDEESAVRARADSWTRVQVRDEITRQLVRPHEDALATSLWRSA